MRTLRAVPLLLALAVSGCILISGQILVTYDLPDMSLGGQLATVPVQVDLNTVSDYRNHKGNLKGLADEALVGLIQNRNSTSLTVEVWITPQETSFQSSDFVTANGILAWGPLTLAPGESRRLTWDASAALITKPGRAAIEGEVRGDGKLTVYVVGDNALNFTEGKFLTIINAGI
jgi:hypothetical protein